MKRILSLVLCLVMTLGLVGCRPQRTGSQDNMGDNKTYGDNLKESTGEKLTVYYNSKYAGMLLNNFEAAYPDLQIEKVDWSGADETITEEDIIQYGRPDIFLLSGNAGLKAMYQKGYIKDITELYGADVEWKADDYFPGVIDTCRIDSMILALPLAVDVSYMTIRESVVEESLFNELADEYTLQEFLDVVEGEMEILREEGVVTFSGTPWDPLDMALLTGVIQIENGQVKMDEEAFKQIYRISSKITANWMEDAMLSVQTVRNAALDPRDGEYVAVTWGGRENSVPQVELIYTQSANDVMLGEKVRVLWMPMVDNANAYGAEVSIVGAVGAEAANPQFAYEALRCMMDMPVQSWVAPQEHLTMYSPVNRQQAIDMVSFVENTGQTEFNILSVDAEREVVEKQQLSDELRDKFENWVNHVQYTYRYDDDLFALPNEMLYDDSYLSGQINDAEMICKEVLAILERDAAGYQ